MNTHDFTRLVRPVVLSRKNYNKIFCIGFNKTGTTTLEAVLRLYGFNLPIQQEQEIRLTRQTFSTEYSEFKTFCSQYDAYQDMPFSQGEVYVVADALFPSSKFILTERISEDWFNSMCNFHKKIFKIENLQKLTENDVKKKFNYLYPGYGHENKRRHLATFYGEKLEIQWQKIYDKEYYINNYEQRNERIKKYFMNAPGKLLVIDVTKEKSTRKICDFLQIPQEFSIDMPHANKT